MSADKTQKDIDILVRQAESSDNPEELGEIARYLEALGAWEEAAVVRRKAATKLATYAEVM